MTLVAEILAIGDELIHGALLDTNSKAIAGELERIGCVVHRFSVTSDDPAHLRAAIADACGRADVVVATGGLGPTLDDRTRDLVAEVLGGPLWFDPASWQQIQDYLGKRGRTGGAHAGPAPARRWRDELSAGAERGRSRCTGRRQHVVPTRSLTTGIHER